MGKYDDFGNFNSQYIIEGELNLGSAMNIGGAETTGDTDNPLAKLIINQKEVPYIPGSSIKGVLRTEIERILRSTNNVVCEPPNTCDPDNQNKSFSDYCVVCGIFGGMGLASHVRIQDSTPLSDNVITGKKPGVGINRTLGIAQKGALYDMEIIHPEQLFKFKMIIENIELIDEKDTLSNEDTRSKAIFYLLVRLMAGHINIGKKSSSGLGNVKLQGVNVTKIWFSEDADDFLEQKTYKVSLKDLSLNVEVIN